MTRALTVAVAEDQVDHRLDQRQQELWHHVADGGDAAELAGRPGDAPGDTDRTLASAIMEVRAARGRERRAPDEPAAPADPAGPAAPGNPAARRQ